MHTSHAPAKLLLLVHACASRAAHGIAFHPQPAFCVNVAGMVFVGANHVSMLGFICLLLLDLPCCHYCSVHVGFLCSGAFCHARTKLPMQLGPSSLHAALTQLTIRWGHKQSEGVLSLRLFVCCQRSCCNAVGMHMLKAYTA